MKIKKTPPSKIVAFRNHSITVYSIGWLAILTNRSSQSVRLWERRQLLPKPILQLNDGFRWYTAAELLGYSKIYNAAGITPGVSIFSSTFAANAGDFHRQLKLELTNKQVIPLAELPDFKRFQEAFSNLKDEALKAKANKILSAAP
jgi:hypothetical protein